MCIESIGILIAGTWMYIPSTHFIALCGHVHPHARDTCYLLICPLHFDQSWLLVGKVLCKTIIIRIYNSNNVTAYAWFQC